MSQDRLQLLQRIPLFAEARLEPAALATLAAAFQPRAFAKGATVFREGDPATQMYVVCEGRVGIFKRAGEARVLLAELGEGSYFGELAVVDGGERSADAEALTDVALLALDDAVFDDLVERVPRLALAFLKATSRRLRAASTQAAVAAPRRGGDGEDTPDAVRDRYPFPVAAVYRSLTVQADARPKVERLFDVLEATLRYVGAVAVACYLDAGRWSENVDELILRGLPKMTLGTWMFALREIAQKLEGHPTRGWLPELYDFVYARPGRPSAAYKQIEGVIGVRNSLRHGAGGALDDRTLEATLAAHLPALEGVLGALGFLADHPLVWLERMDYVRGAFAYRYQRCMGSHADFESGALTLKEPKETGQLYLLHRDGGRLLPLHPWLLLDACSVCRLREVFMLYDCAGEAVEYSEMVRGHHHLAPAPREALEALRRDARARLHRAEEA